MNHSTLYTDLFIINYL